MATIAELRQILKEDTSGKNLYDHITETLMKILIERPANAYDNFELISAQVKENPLNPDPEVGRPVPPSTEEIKKQTEWTQRCSKLLKIPDEPPENNDVKVPDLLDEASLYAWTGLGIGKSETYKLYLSIKALAETLPSEVERLRFFGRITTRTLPYYIVEGNSVEDPEDLDEKIQEGKAGANKYTYWVTQSTESNVWVKLPHVTMAQIVQARKFKRFFTGDLNAPVPSYPPFDGKESNLLRTQIARIVGSTSISPDGFYEIEEDSEPPVVKLVEGEEALADFPKPAKDLKEPDSWKHHVTDLNPLGRVNPVEPILDDNEEVLNQDQVDVEVIQPLESVNPENWNFRLCPDGAGATDANSLVVARNLIWPGAMAIAGGKRYVNIYFGNGIIQDKTTYTPPMPAPIQTEWNMNGIEGEESEELDPNSGAGKLIEMEDTRVDPTPPVVEEEEEEG